MAVVILSIIGLLVGYVVVSRRRLHNKRNPPSSATKVFSPAKTSPASHNVETSAVTDFVGHFMPPGSVKHRRSNSEPVVRMDASRAGTNTNLLYSTVTTFDDCRRVSGGAIAASTIDENSEMVTPRDRSVHSSSSNSPSKEFIPNASSRRRWQSMSLPMTSADFFSPVESHRVLSDEEEGSESGMSVEGEQGSTPPHGAAQPSWLHRTASSAGKILKKIPGGSNRPNEQAEGSTNVSVPAPQPHSRSQSQAGDESAASAYQSCEIDVPRHEETSSGDAYNAQHSEAPRGADAMPSGSWRWPNLAFGSWGSGRSAPSRDSDRTSPELRHATTGSYRSAMGVAAPELAEGSTGSSRFLSQDIGSILLKTSSKSPEQPPAVVRREHQQMLRESSPQHSGRLKPLKPRTTGTLSLDEDAFSIHMPASPTMQNQMQGLPTHHQKSMLHPDSRPGSGSGKEYKLPPPPHHHHQRPPRTYNNSGAKATLPVHSLQQLPASTVLQVGQPPQVSPPISQPQNMYSSGSRAAAQPSRGTLQVNADSDAPSKQLRKVVSSLGKGDEA